MLMLSCLQDKSGLESSVCPWGCQDAGGSHSSSSHSGLLGHRLGRACGGSTLPGTGSLVIMVGECSCGSEDPNTDGGVRKRVTPGEAVPSASQQGASREQRLLPSRAGPSAHVVGHFQDSLCHLPPLSAPDHFLALTSFHGVGNMKFPRRTVRKVSITLL